MGEQDENSLLTSVNGVINKWSKNHKSKEIHGEAFNVFALCGVDHYELWHSKILAEFLNPGGSHGQGTQFLQSFAEMFLSGCVFSDDTSVSTEVTSYIKDLRIGRFDILIEDIAKKSVCIIENKIFAGEQEEQLNRYHEWLKTNRSGWNSCLVFLTLDGHMSATMSDENQYLRIAYVSDTNHLSLADWIEECANSVKEIPRLCYTFVQYKDHIQKLANGDKAMSNKIIDAFNKRMAAAQSVYENYKTACVVKANSILTDLVLKELGEGWRTDGSCSFERTNYGIHYIPPEPNLKDLPIKIYVVFGATNLWQCQVALYQDISKIHLAANDGLELEYSDETWKKDFSKTQSWPLWRGINTTKDEPWGMTWDGKFFDMMDADDGYRTGIISDIVESIKALHSFLKDYAK